MCIQSVTPSETTNPTVTTRSSLRAAAFMADYHISINSQMNSNDHGEESSHSSSGDLKDDMTALAKRGSGEHQRCLFSTGYWISSLKNASTNWVMMPVHISEITKSCARFYIPSIQLGYTRHLDVPIDAITAAIESRATQHLLSSRTERLFLTLWKFDDSINRATNRHKTMGDLELIRPKRCFLC